MTRSVVRKHLTVDAVADHLEGLLPDAVAVEAEGHLRVCADCSAVRDDLLTVRETLAAQRADPMPDAVALRIESMLAEAWSDLSTGRAAAVDARSQVTATDTDLAAAETSAAAADLLLRQQARPVRVRKRRVIPIFAAAAGTIGVVFAAAVIGPQLTSVSDRDDSGEAAPVTAQDQGGRAGADLLEEDDGSAAMGAENGQAPAEGLPAIPVGQSGRDYTSYTFAAGVADLLAAARTLTGGQPPSFPEPLVSPEAPLLSGSSPPTVGPTRPSATPFPLAAPGQPLAPFVDGGPHVRACIRELAGSDVEPILVDLGTFAGDPAVIIVLPNRADPASATAWAVDHRCGNGLPADETTFAVVTTPHPTAAPVPTPSSTTNRPAPLTVEPETPATPSP